VRRTILNIRTLSGEISLKVIKRYKNRRLYDTDLKRFITHSDLYRIIELKTPFKVIDSRSQKDITAVVLGQLLLGRLKSWEDVRESKELLIEIINKGGKKTMSILRNTFLASVGFINLTRKKAEELVDSLIEAGKISKSDRKQAVMELLDKAEETTKKMKDKIAKESGAVQKELNKALDMLKKYADKLPQRRIMTELDKINKKVDDLSRRLDEKQ
jgi:polyhydroxyalkanoate synthesis repressor PhaR